MYHHDHYHFYSQYSLYKLGKDIIKRSKNNTDISLYICTYKNCVYILWKIIMNQSLSNHYNYPYCYYYLINR